MSTTFVHCTNMVWLSATASPHKLLEIMMASRTLKCFILSKVRESLGTRLLYTVNLPSSKPVAQTKQNGYM